MQGDPGFHISETQVDDSDAEDMEVDLDLRISGTQVDDLDDNDFRQEMGDVVNAISTPVHVESERPDYSLVGDIPPKSFSNGTSTDAGSEEERENDSIDLRISQSQPPIMGLSNNPLGVYQQTTFSGESDGRPAATFSDVITGQSVANVSSLMEIQNAHIEQPKHFEAMQSVEADHRDQTNEDSDDSIDLRISQTQLPNSDLTMGKENANDVISGKLVGTVEVAEVAEVHGKQDEGKDDGEDAFDLCIANTQMNVSTFPASNNEASALYPIVDEQHPASSAPTQLDPDTSASNSFTAPSQDIFFQDHQTFAPRPPPITDGISGTFTHITFSKSFVNLDAEDVAPQDKSEDILLSSKSNLGGESMEWIQARSHHDDSSQGLTKISPKEVVDTSPYSDSSSPSIITDGRPFPSNPKPTDHNKVQLEPNVSSIVDVVALETQFRAGGEKAQRAKEALRQKIEELKRLEALFIGDGNGYSEQSKRSNEAAVPTSTEVEPEGKTPRRFSTFGATTELHGIATALAVGTSIDETDNASKALITPGSSKYRRKVQGFLSSMQPPLSATKDSSIAGGVSASAGKVDFSSKKDTSWAEDEDSLTISTSIFKKPSAPRSTVDNASNNKDDSPPGRQQQQAKPVVLRPFFQTPLQQKDVPRNEQAEEDDDVVEDTQDEGFTTHVATSGTQQKAFQRLRKSAEKESRKTKRGDESESESESEAEGDAMGGVDLVCTDNGLKFPASFVKNGVPGTWTELWAALEYVGWRWTKGRGLIDFFYLIPGIERVEKEHKVGIDYFVSTDDVVAFVVKAISTLHPSATKTTSLTKNSSETKAPTVADAAVVEEENNDFAADDVEDKAEVHTVRSVDTSLSSKVVGKDGVIPASFLHYGIPAIWSELWASLEHVGWHWTKGRGLIDFFYLKPGIDRVLPKEHKLGVDYFTSTDDVVDFVQQVIDSLLPRDRQVQKKQQVSSDLKKTSPPGDDKTLSTKTKASEKASDKRVHEKDDEEFDSGNDKIQRPQPQSKKSSQRDVLQTSDVSHHSPAPQGIDIRRASWKEIWKVLRPLGWLWDYGPNHINYFYAPGYSAKADKEAILGVHKFESEDAVRRFIKRQLKHVESAVGWPQFVYHPSASSAPSSATKSHPTFDASQFDSQADFDAHLLDPSWMLSSHRPKRVLPTDYTTINKPRLEPESLSSSTAASGIQQHKSRAAAADSLGAMRQPYQQPQQPSKKRQRVEDDVPSTVSSSHVVEYEHGASSGLVRYPTLARQPPRSSLSRAMTLDEATQPQCVTSSPMQYTSSSSKRLTSVPTLLALSPMKVAPIERSVASSNSGKKRSSEDLNPSTGAAAMAALAPTSTGTPRIVKTAPSSPLKTSSEKASTSTVGKSQKKRGAQQQQTESAMLQGLEILLSGFADDVKELLETTIARHSGRVLQKLPAVLIELLQDSSYTSAAQNQQQTRDVAEQLDNLLLLSKPAEFRKLKYIHAVIAGVRIVHFHWLVHSVQRGCLQPLDPYMLSTGYSALHAHYLFPPTLPPRLRTTSNTNTNQPLRHFAGMRILNATGSKQWDDLLTSLGVFVVTCTEDMCRHLLSVSAADFTLQQQQSNARGNQATTNRQRRVVDYLLFDPVTYSKSVLMHAQNHQKGLSNSVSAQHQQHQQVQQSHGKRQAAQPTTSSSATSTIKENGPVLTTWQLQMLQHSHQLYVNCHHLYPAVLQDDGAVAQRLGPAPVVSIDYLVHCLYLQRHDILPGALDIFTLPRDLYNGGTVFKLDMEVDYRSSASSTSAHLHHKRNQHTDDNVAASQSALLERYCKHDLVYYEAFSSSKKRSRSPPKGHPQSEEEIDNEDDDVQQQLPSRWCIGRIVEVKRPQISAERTTNTCTLSASDLARSSLLQGKGEDRRGLQQQQVGRASSSSLSLSSSLSSTNSSMVLLRVVPMERVSLSISSTSGSVSKQQQKRSTSCIYTALQPAAAPEVLLTPAQLRGKVVVVTRHVVPQIDGYLPPWSTTPSSFIDKSPNQYYHPTLAALRAALRLQPQQSHQGRSDDGEAQEVIADERDLIYVTSEAYEDEYPLRAYLPFSRQSSVVPEEDNGDGDDEDVQPQQQKKRYRYASQDM